MAHQKLGQSAEARKELEAGRKRLGGLGRVLLLAGFITTSRLMNYGWTEWLHASRPDEAEAPVLDDPIFPADRFAR